MEGNKIIRHVMLDAFKITERITVGNPTRIIPYRRVTFRVFTHMMPVI